MVDAFLSLVLWMSGCHVQMCWVMIKDVSEMQPVHRALQLLTAASSAVQL